MLFFYQQHGQTTGPLTATEFLAALKHNAVDLDTKVRTDASMVWMTLPYLLKSGLLEKAAQAAAAGQPTSPREAQRQRLRTLAYSHQGLASLPAKEFGSLPTRTASYGYFLSHEFPVDGPPGPCTVYPHKAAEERAIFTWQAEFQGGKTGGSLKDLAPILHLLLGPLGLLIGLAASHKGKKEKVVFRTAHDFSHLAADHRRWAWRAARVLHILFIIGVILLLFFGLFLLVAALAAFAEDYPGTEHDRLAHIFSFTLSTFFALATMVLVTYHFAKTLRLPPALRTLEKSPLRLTKITWQPLRQNYQNRL